MAIDLGMSDKEALMAQLRRQGFTGAQAGYIAGVDLPTAQGAYDRWIAEMVPQVGAVDLATYQNQRDLANLQYKQGMANVDFQQGNAVQNYGMSRDNLVRQFDQMREKLPYSYNSRGLMNSGIYKQGLTDFGESRVRGLNQFDTAHQQTMGGFGLQKQQLSGALKTQQENVNRLEQARRAQTAAQIKAVQ